MKSTFLTLNHYKHKWKHLKKLSGWRSLLSFSEPLYLLAQTTPFKNLRTLDALRTFLAGLTAYLTILKTAVNEAWTNKRFRVGVIVGMVAIPMWKSHLFFDINVRMDDFYYVNYAFYFNTIRAYLCGIFLATGFFIAAAQKWRFRWWALPVVIFCATEIYAESFYTHWTDFYNSMPGWQVWTITAFSVPAVYFSINYLAYRKYHLKDGNVDRFKGIIKAPGIPLETKMDILESLVQESENFNARI